MVYHRSIVAAFQALAIISNPSRVASFQPAHNVLASKSRTQPITDSVSSGALRYYRHSSSPQTRVSSQPNNATPDVFEEKELTPATIAEMIEVSFLNSCLQLSQGYIDVLKLFTVSVKAGYETNLPLDELHQLVEDCPVNSAGRDLMKEEKALRLEWMTVVYEMLNVLKNPGDSSIVVDSGKNNDSTENERIQQVVRAMLEIQNGVQSEEQSTGGEQDAMVTLNTLTVEQAVERSALLSKVYESTTDPMAKAFLTNDIRVALMTFRVLEEENVCMQDSAGRTNTGGEGEGVPRPSIPGT